MPKYIIDWSDEAIDTFKVTFSKLVNEFNLGIANKFRKYTYELLDDLSMNNKLCPKSKRANLRRCITHKNTSLIYERRGKMISLVAFIDNRSNHKY